MSTKLNIFGFKLGFRVLILVLLSLALGQVFFKSDWIFMQLVLISGIAITVWDFNRLVHSTNKRLNSFLESAYHNEFSTVIDSGLKGAGFQQLVGRFKALNQRWEEQDKNRRKEALLFEHVLQLQQVGIAVLDHSNKVLMSNSSFFSLLGLPTFKHLNQIKSSHPSFYKRLFQMEHQQILRMKIEESGYAISDDLILTKLISLSSKEEVQVFFVQKFEEHLLHRESEEWMSLVKTLGHEIMNRVSPIISMSEYLDSGSIQDPSSAIEKIKIQSKALLSLADQYRSLVQVQEPSKERFEWRSFLERITSKYNKVQFSLNGDALDKILFADPSQLEQVFDNLINNALEAQATKLEIKVLSGGFNYIILITDNGNGIRPDLYAKIFLPFFSSKEDGSGIGLSLARQLLWKHKGGISLVKSDSGTCFKVRIPAEV